MTTEWPFLKSDPAMAGNRANARDSDASDEDSGAGMSVDVCALGFRISLASLRLYSEKLEGRRGGMAPSNEDSDLAMDRLRVGKFPTDSSMVFARRIACPGGALLTPVANPVDLLVGRVGRDEGAPPPPPPPVAAAGCGGGGGEREPPSRSGDVDPMLLLRASFTLCFCSSPVLLPGEEALSHANRTCMRMG